MQNASKKKGPLAGYRIIELAGIGPGPYCGRLLCDLGADVIVVHRPEPGMKTVDTRAKQSIIVDFKNPQAAEIVLRLVEGADALIEGYRPGVAERLGVGPADCKARNPKLVYGRMTGWGQGGPWSEVAGHDINYLSITGALHAMGGNGEPPSPPLNLVGDYGGGSLFLAFGVLAALLKAGKTGEGDIVDAAIVDGVSSMMGIIYSLHALGLWSTTRQSNILDGGSPYYRCYKTSDDGFMAVGCIEAKFFAIMLEKLEISTEQYGDQNDRACWPRQHEMLEDIFRSKTRAYWQEVFDGSDACVTPVLDYLEAPQHKHNLARRSHQALDGLVQPGPAPRIGDAPPFEASTPVIDGADTRAVLEFAGYTAAEIDEFVAAGAIHASAP